MNIEQRKATEEKILKVLESLNDGEKAIIYKQLNASGYTLSNCDKKISISPPGETSMTNTPSAAAPADNPWAYGFIV